MKWIISVIHHGIVLLRNLILYINMGNGWNNFQEIYGAWKIYYKSCIEIIKFMFIIKSTKI